MCFGESDSEDGEEYSNDDCDDCDDGDDGDDGESDLDDGDDGDGDLCRRLDLDDIGRMLPLPNVAEFVSFADLDDLTLRSVFVFNRTLSVSMCG